MPVIVSPANAVFYQEVIQKSDSVLSDYNVIGKVRNSHREGLPEDSVRPVDSLDTTVENLSGTKRDFVGMGEYLGQEEKDGWRVTVNDYTLSERSAEYFPEVTFVGDRLARRYLKQIGLVVFKVYRDTADSGKMNFFPVESFVGSLDPEAVDEVTGERVFIDDIVNGNSRYVNLFSNVPVGENGYKNASILAVNNQVGCSMGFYEADTEKRIHVSKSIYEAMLKIFNRNGDKNVLEIDVVEDAGVSNIAQFVASTCQTDKNGNFVKDQFLRSGFYDLASETAHLFKMGDRGQINVWRKVIQRFDDFASNTRKDVIFVADGPRQLCLTGNSKIVRRTNPSNTVQNSILPKIRLISGIFNSSYSAGYLDWFYSLDHDGGNYMWMPPSIKVAGVYLYTDTYGRYWYAPAGLNRGVVSDTTDLAFSPTNEEAGQIYVNSWNYAVNYPVGGIVVEG